MTSSLNIGIAGLGTVGCATANLLRQHSALLATRTGKRVNIAAVSARDLSKDRPIDMGSLHVVPDPMELATSDNIDCVVELIGGAEGVAKELVTTALEQGKHVVTANKALIAHHGLELAEIAEKNQVQLAFEAAVAGGIPVVKTLRESLAGNQCSTIRGILNGTSNYILSEMGKSKRPFADILKDAQDKGYAEADPTFDIDGTDAAHKLCILSSIAFGTTPQIQSVHKEGMEHITPADLEYAAQLGYAVKIIGTATQTDHGVIQGVYPTMVPLDSPLAQVHDVLNAVSLDGDKVGSVFLEGPGAGGDPTASSVVADIADIARGTHYFAFGAPTTTLNAQRPPKHQLQTSYYLRTATSDQAGVLADITRIYHGQNISVDIMVQPRHTTGEPAELVFKTHPTTEESIHAAVAAIGALPTVVTEPQIIRIMS